MCYSIHGQFLILIHVQLVPKVLSNVRLRYGIETWIHSHVPPRYQSGLRPIGRDYEKSENDQWWSVTAFHLLKRSHWLASGRWQQNSDHINQFFMGQGAYPHSDIPPFRHTNPNPNPNLSGVPALRQLEDTVGVVGCWNGDMSLLRSPVWILVGRWLMDTFVMWATMSLRYLVGMLSWPVASFKWELVFLNP